jgi:UDP:flavonoid glycosyltransferase YjiC (YdhE family)
MISQKILIAPLDWGLGHATRCIPIIKELLNRGCQVDIAASGDAGKLLLQEFPSLTHHVIPAYGISYPKKGNQFMLRMILQLPRIFFAIQKEHRWLIEKQQDHQWDCIISDNRYGFWHPATKTVFIIHQLRILSGWGKTIDRWIQYLHYKMILRFNHCWVPDSRDEPSLAGALSHPQPKPHNAVYIGPLSRLEARSAEEKKIVVALSGPEPQRTLLENTLIQIFSDETWESHEILFLRGLPSLPLSPASPSNLVFVNHLNSTSFSTALAEASLVICRSGYSTVMDLIKLQKKAVLIPTPGQTEQEYLAIWLEQKNIFHTCSQDNPKLGEVIKQATSQRNCTIQADFEGYKKALDDLGIQ